MSLRLEDYHKWSPLDEQELARLRAEKDKSGTPRSFTSIAACLNNLYGYTLTKNAVLSRWHKINGNKTTYYVKGKDYTTKRRSRGHEPVVPQHIESVKLWSKVDTPPNVLDRQCMYEVDCRLARQPAKPYCAHHCNIVLGKAIRKHHALEIDDYEYGINIVT